MQVAARTLFRGGGYGVGRMLSRSMSSQATPLTGPWAERMPEKDFAFMREILAAPSPVGLEESMVSVLESEREEFFPPAAKDWGVHRFKGSSSLVWDTAPGRTDLLTVMFVGHLDKIRMQVRHIASDGKIYIDSDSFLPMTLIGNEVAIFSRKNGTYNAIKGGTVEALGAIHFASVDQRSGAKGVKPEQLYVELGLHGEERNKQVERAGIRVGDSIILERPIKRAFAPDSFSGAYLDNGLGCFATAEVARMVAANPESIPGVRCLFTFVSFTTTSHEEIGRFGSRVVAGEMDKVDILIAVDVNHDYEAAPNVGDKRFPPIKMGGAVASATLNGMLEDVATEAGIPIQHDVCGRDTGTDAMAGVLASIDCAATSVGFPIRNMHTVSELGHTGDVLAAVHVLHGLVTSLHKRTQGQGADFFLKNHPRLDRAGSVKHDGIITKVDKESPAPKVAETNSSTMVDKDGKTHTWPSSPDFC